MKISVFGLGYVGVVSAACLAHDGHSVIGVDVNPYKIDLINAGKSPIHESGLEELLGNVVQTGQLKASLNSNMAVKSSEVCLICVGTPSNQNGGINLQYVENVCREIGTALQDQPDHHIIVVRCTVPPQTVRNKLIPLLEEYSHRRAGVDFGVCMNPEFLREGSAIEDYYHPGYIVIGELDSSSGDVVERMYSAVKAPIIRKPIETVEMVKYVSNSFHALKIVFANEIGNFCKAHNIDGQEVMDIFCQDHHLNISPFYLKPGYAFGGSCLPKDLRALLYCAKERDLELPVLSSLLPSNNLQIQRGINMVESTGRHKIGILGLSFKPYTDDVRESPTINLVETLIGRGYDVFVFDENVDPEKLIGANKIFLERELPHIASLIEPTLNDLMSHAEVVVITTSSATFHEVPQLLRDDQILIDLVGIAKNVDKKGKYDGICW